MTNTNPDNPIRVCFISPKAYPIFNPRVQSVFGGAEVDLYTISTELAKDSRYDVSFIVADYGQPGQETIGNVRIIKSLDFKKNPITGARKIWAAFKQANADIYIIKTASPGVPLLAQFCKKNKKVFVYRTASTRECDGTYLKQHCVLGRLFRNALKKADCVFTQNRNDRDNLQQSFGVDSTVIRNAHHLPSIFHGQKKFILWVGRSAKVKGPQRFIELAQRFNKEKFVMICQRATGDDDYDALVKKATAIENIEFHPRVNYQQVGEYFHNAKIFVNTSDSEGFPNTFIEACKYATSILSYQVNPDGFIDKYNCGQHCKGNMEQLTESLKYMLDQERYVKMGQDARDYVEQHHDIQMIIEKYKAIFSRCNN